MQHLVSLATEPYGKVKVVGVPGNVQYGFSVLGKREVINNADVQQSLTFDAFN